MVDPAEGESSRDAAGGGEPERALIDRFLANPITGFLPWIVLAVIEGPGRIALACAVALAMSVLFLVVEKLRGSSPKALSFVDVAAFGSFLIGALVASPGTTTWLETWFGEIANIVLVLFVAVSLLVRQPFTLQYAKEQTPEEYWDSPTFLRVNYVITAVWGLAFLGAAIAGWYGDAVLHSNNNLWTGWVLQIFASLIAVAFTDWYPDYATARSLEEAGLPTDPPPPVSDLFGQLAVYVLVIGIISLVFDGGPTALGVGLIVLGAVLAGVFRRSSAATRATQQAAAPGT
jgi:hypothetical protein